MRQNKQLRKALPLELRREGEIWKLDGERSTEGNREKYKEIQRDTGGHRETQKDKRIGRERVALKLSRLTLKDRHAAHDVCGDVRRRTLHAACCGFYCCDIFEFQLR